MKTHQQKIERFRKEIISELLKEASKFTLKKGVARSSLLLGEIDCPAEVSAKKEILKELEKGGAILNFNTKLETIKRAPTKFTDLEIEANPEEIFEIQQEEKNWLPTERNFYIADVTYYPKQLQKNLKKFSSTPIIIIKDIDLVQNSLIVNGKSVIKFQIRGGQSKTLKIFSELFKGVKKKKNNRPFKNTGLVSDSVRKSVAGLEWLREVSGCPSINAVRQRITQLNNFLKKRGLSSIEIRTYDKKAIMVITMKV